MFRLHQVVHRAASFDESCYLVDAFVHSFVADALRTVELTGCRVEGKFQGQWQRIRIIAGMRSGMGNRALILHSPLLQALGGKSCGSHRHIEDFGDGGADGSFINLRIAQGHIIGNDASLAVGRIGQIVEPRLPVRG